MAPGAVRSTGDGRSRRRQASARGKHEGSRNGRERAHDSQRSQVARLDDLLAIVCRLRRLCHRLSSRVSRPRTRRAVLSTSTLTPLIVLGRSPASTRQHACLWCAVRLRRLGSRRQPAAARYWPGAAAFAPRARVRPHRVDLLTVRCQSQTAARAGSGSLAAELLALAVADGPALGQQQLAAAARRALHRQHPRPIGQSLRLRDVRAVFCRRRDAVPRRRCRDVPMSVLLRQSMQQGGVRCLRTGRARRRAVHADQRRGSLSQRALSLQDRLTIQTCWACAYCRSRDDVSIDLGGRPACGACFDSAAYKLGLPALTSAKPPDKHGNRAVDELRAKLVAHGLESAKPAPRLPLQALPYAESPVVTEPPRLPKPQVVLDICPICAKTLRGALRIISLPSGQRFHPACFTCATCKTAIAEREFIELDDGSFAHPAVRPSRRTRSDVTVCR